MQTCALFLCAHCTVCIILAADACFFLQWDYAASIPIRLCHALEKQCEKASASQQFGKQPPNYTHWLHTPGSLNREVTVYKEPANNLSIEKLSYCCLWYDVKSERAREGAAMPALLLWEMFSQISFWSQKHLFSEDIQQGTVAATSCPTA